MAVNVQDILDEIENKKAEAAEKKGKAEPYTVEVLPVYADDSGEAAVYGRGVKFKTLLMSLIPAKSDPVREIIRKIIFIISLVVAIVCFVLILSSSWAGRAHNATYTELRNEMERSAEQFALSGQVFLPAGAVAELIEKDMEALRVYAYELSEVIDLTDERILEILVERPGILPHFITTYDRNNDLIGWLRIPGTSLDYPVLQYRRYLEDGTVTGDNHYYLSYSIDHVNSMHGSIYAEWRHPFTPTSRPDNTVLYGHNMNDGTKMHPAVRYYAYYYSSPGHTTFYRNHPIIEFSTLYEQFYYKVFAAIFVHTEENKYDDVYDYFRKREFSDRASFYDFMQNIMDRSSFYTDVDIMYGDEIITLSTCHYPLGEHIDARVAVFARRLREDESPDDFDIDAVYVNPSPLYFTLYYQRLGGSWAGRNWDTDKVIGLDEFLLENPDADTRLHYLTLW
ncbi:MAG: class B sortase [Oscillospiraceae bacterium]|jgi:SrtB family sortase|nr:class B sortase [Oscillospiraceae bacterium]